ncbi:MAG: hypothetical protein ABIQ16_00055 [Polyangiaceae bacterium]
MTSKLRQKSTWWALFVGGTVTALAAQACSVDKGKYTFDNELFEPGVTDPNAGNGNAGGSFGGDGSSNGGMPNGGDGGDVGDGGDGAVAGASPSGGNGNPGAGAGNGGCTVGEHACTDDGHLQTCKAGKPSAFDAGVACGDGRCSASQGVCLQCAPGEFKCSNTTLQQCNIFGAVFEDVAVCDSKASCVASDQKGYCVQCKAGTASCEANQIREMSSQSDSAQYAANRLLTCNADGSGVDTNAVCEADKEVCNATGKTCQRCTPNAYFCDGATLNQCTADGTNYNFSKSCSSATLCDAVNGKCNVGVCTPGQFNCVGATLQSCGRDGNWTTLDTCASAALCDSSYGRCQVCSTSGSTCSGSNVQQCDYNGGQNTPYTYQSCTANACYTSGSYANCTTCKVGTISCYPNGSSYYLCGAGGIQNSVSCPTGQVCNPAAVTDASATKCVTCVPGRYSCDSNGTVLKKCSADGSSLDLVENCQTSNKFCDAGRGLCIQANAGNFACADNGDLLQIGYDNNHVLTSRVVDSCGNKNLCDSYSASCRKGQCVVGETTCSGADVYACDSGDYRRRTGTRCATATRCQDGFGCVKTLALAAGDAHTCAIVAGADANEGDSGYVLCWGANESGQLGNGSPLLTDSKEARQVVVSQSDSGTGNGGPHVVAPYFSGICAGKNFTCADLDSGESDKHFVACWGSNAKGQLGVNLAEPGPFNAPFSAVSDGGVIGGDGIAVGSVTCGAEFACALGTDGTAYCWGANESGQLGTGSVGLPSIAASAIDGHLFTQLTAGAHHVCGVQADGSVYCWGANESGQLGNGLTKASASPILVAKVTAVADRPLALGNDFTLALAAKAAKNPFAWGSNHFGQLGNASLNDSVAPTALSGIASSDIANAGTLYSGSTAEHACARIGDTLECWGANVFGEVGDGTTGDRTSPVVVFDGKTTATQVAPGNHSVAVGGRHTCAITVKGDVMCWGANHRSQLGSSVLTPQRTPVRGY